MISLFVQASGGYVIVALLFIAVILFALARLFSSVWLQIWLDHGDGREEERRENMTLYNQTFTSMELKGNGDEIGKMSQDLKKFIVYFKDM